MAGSWLQRLSVCAGSEIPVMQSMSAALLAGPHGCCDTCTKGVWRVTGCVLASRELRTDAAALQVDMPEIATLNAALTALTDWQVTIQADRDSLHLL